jgi:hypothetical protein
MTETGVNTAHHPLQHLSFVVGICSVILSAPVCIAVTRLYLKSLDNKIFNSTATNKSNLMFLMAVAILSNALNSANMSFLFPDLNMNAKFDATKNTTVYQMNIACKVQGALTQSTLQTNVVSLMCITYEVYSTFNTDKITAEKRFKRYLQVLFFPLLLVLFYLVIITDGTKEMGATGFSPSMAKANYGKEEFSFCWIFYTELRLYIAAYTPLLISICLTGYTLLKIRKLMLTRANEDVTLRNRFMRIFRKLVAFPLVTFMCWLPVITYWLLALSKGPEPRNEFYKFLDVMIHIIFPAFVLIQSIVAYCCNDKIKNEVLFVCKGFCCICSLCCKDRNRRNTSITNRSNVDVLTNSGKLETPFIDTSHSESSFGDDDSISSFTDGSVRLF